MKAFNAVKPIARIVPYGEFWAQVKKEIPTFVPVTEVPTPHIVIDWASNLTHISLETKNGHGVVLQPTLEKEIRSALDALVGSSVTEELLISATMAIKGWLQHAFELKLLFEVHFGSEGC